MSEDSGKRGLRAFMDWVENGPDWEDEAGVRRRPRGRRAWRGRHHCVASDQAVREIQNGLWAGGLRNLRRNMPCVYSAVSTGL